MSRYIVTITPPTPNGDLHIGHISGPFLAADVFARVQRQRGHQCVLLSYSDDYQSYMLRKGMELDTDPVALARSNTDRIERSLAAVGIEMDFWMRPWDNPFFAEAVSQVFEAAQAAGAIEFRESMEPYCPHCKVWGYEAFGRGLCNFCGVDSDASQCEGCAQAPDAAKMANFRCKLCQRPHTWTPARRAFLKLGEFKETLRAVHAKSEHRFPLDGWLDEAIRDLVDWGVTRPGDAGLDLRPDGSCRVHTWFMGLAGYMAAFREHAQRIGAPQLYDEYWTSGAGKLVHFLGFDCVFSHALVYPALLSTLPHERVQQQFYPNQFLKLDGLNLSTSRNHAIWARELVEQACTDSVRLYLASIAPEEAEGNFERTVFQAWRKAVFTDLVPRLLAAGAGGDRDWWQAAVGADRALLQALRQQWLAAGDPERFSMKAMSGVMLDAIAMARERLDGGRPVSYLAAFIAVAGKSLTPRLSAQLLDAFALDEEEVTRSLVDGSVAEYSI